MRLNDTQFIFATGEEVWFALDGKGKAEKRMIKDIIDANEAVTPGGRELVVLRDHFPACFSADGSFDIERFKEYLSDKIAVTNEGYELRFLGKNYARLLASLDTTTVIVPDDAHNSKPENANSQNIYISGDNLDGLKHLLKSYAKKIKCIYIDPPYNTGKDEFAYNDRFNFTVEELAEKLSVNEDQAQRILDLTKRGSASHSAWLMFMYPRLLLARDLLRDDGVMFVSVDDNEQGNLKLLLDDVFGEDNFLGTIIWKNATDNNPTRIAVEHEYVICFARNQQVLEPVWKSSISAVKDLLVKIGEKLSKEYPDDQQFQEAWSNWYRAHKDQLSPLDRYKYIDRGGVYTGSQSVHNPGREGYRYDVIHPVTGKPCTQPLMGYRFPEATMNELLASGRVLFGEDENKIIELKVYAYEYMDKLSSVYELDGRLGAYDIKALFPEAKQLFKNPKPVQLLERILSFSLNDGDIFLDFFGGSGTSSEAFYNFITSTRINACFIHVQLREETKVGSEASSLGYSTIDQIGIERIIRAAKKIREKHPDTTADIGFQHFTLAEPSAATLDKLERFEPETGFLLHNTVLQDFGVPTVLATWLVRDGYGFTAPVQVVDFDGYTGYYMDKHLYLINPDLRNEAIAAITAKYETDGAFNPENVVLCGYSFTWTETESLKVNLARLKDTEKNLRINFDIRY